MMGTPVEVPEPRKMNENAAIMRRGNLIGKKWKEREFARARRVWPSPFFFGWISWIRLDLVGLRAMQIF